MYSVMLMAALSGSAEVPEFGRRGCHGCYSYACSGCYGGWDCHGSRGGLFSRRRHGCHGCYSYACSGCYGYVSYGCHGCYGGYVSYGCHGCWGGYSHGCHGCHGYYAAPAGPQRMPEREREKAPPPKTGKEETMRPAPATLVVELPEDAKLTIDGAPTASTSSVRTFVTPDLAPQKEFSYTLQAQIVRDGHTLTASERVQVRAGQETRVSLTATKFSGAAVARK
jgi:uncharacterized protein (TIGR03000 family)